LVNALGSEGLLEAHIGHFGHKNFGNRFSGYLYYNQGNNSRACEPLRDTEKKEFIGLNEKGNFMLLVDHGGCSHLQKAFNAQ
jgi:hypothetical protein